MFADIVDSCNDKLAEVVAQAITLDPNLIRGLVLQEDHQTDSNKPQRSKFDYRRQQREETIVPSSGRVNINVLGEQLSSVDHMSLSSTSLASAVPICRQFWKAGNYEGLASKSILQKSGCYVHIHPKFLHSNATSHKWVFGAIAELLDNAVDEIQNGATFVNVDKTLNPKDGRPALLIQDDGGGMDPEGIRCCLSFGFSDKKSKSAIGRYGNGFKTSSMRLGADVIVFSRHLQGRKLMQSCGLLSCTYLMQTGLDRVVVPMVDYDLDTATGTLEMLNQCNKENFMSNLAIMLQWSPYSTEAELLKQFDDIGHHGTKVIIYNLWYTDEGTMELDFDSDPKDIRLGGARNFSEKVSSRLLASEQHMANQLRDSLRVYLSILYMRIPENFAIILRGQVVLSHNIASDLKYPEFIVYKPHSNGTVEGSVVTTIGFLKEAPHVNVHGFNVYHRNRLILPFWHVVSDSNKRGRGVVGVLEANFIEPTHNKQDFEKTPVFQKLETRLKDMTLEYWYHHCELIGYHETRKKSQSPVVPNVSAHGTSHSSKVQPSVLNKSSSMSATARAIPLVPQLKRKEGCQLAKPELVKRRPGVAVNGSATSMNQPFSSTVNSLEDLEAVNLMQENEKLRAQCKAHEKSEEELKLKVARLRCELESLEYQHTQLLEKIKEESM